MTFDDFLSVFSQIIKEFKYLNEHFDSKLNSKIADYNKVFNNWKMDMYRIHRNLIFDMHWATSSPQIAHNEMLFDVRFQGVFLCEVKYRFDEKFVATYMEEINNALEIFKQVTAEFHDLNRYFNVDLNPVTSDYENLFNLWKKSAYYKFNMIALDLHWALNTGVIDQNPVYLSIMYKDNCLFEIQYNLFKEMKRNLDELG